MDDKPAKSTEYLTLEALVAVADALADIQNYILATELGEDDQKIVAIKSFYDRRSDLLNAIKALLEMVKSNGSTGS